MPNVLPTIPNDPPQGIQALLDKVYLWNPDVSNDLIEKINALLAKLGDAIGAIRPYNEMVAPINQYEPCYYGGGVYVAKNYLAELAEEFNEEDWILIAHKEITADKIHINFAGQEDTIQGAIDTLKTDQDELGDQVSGIESKIPESASETNQLATKDELNSYLQLSGGTLTGDVAFNTYAAIGATYVDGLIIKRQILGDWKNLYYIHSSAISPSDNGNKDLGHSSYKWRSAYVTKLNNGADIIVPTVGGTLALAEDIAESVTTKDLTVGTEEGTLNIGITAGVATIATNNGLDIVSQTKFDTAPTTDDTTAWADVNSTALVTKQQVAAALSTAGGGSSITIRNWL